ncbi:MAG: CvpA family protein [Firmicutes bacterium]|jgi:membrane protein required for colicin V production|nr:CvpA family protein [Bacillota bacterium]
MTWIDIGIILILIVMMLKGFIKGLVREACELAGIVFGILYAYRSYYYWGDELIYRFTIPEVIAYPLAFGGIVVIISMLAGFIGILLHKVLRYTPISLLNHLGGIGLGFAKGFIVVCLVLVLLSAVPFEGLMATMNKSPLAQQFLAVVPRLYGELEGVLPPEFPRWHREDLPADQEVPPPSTPSAAPVI